MRRVVTACATCKCGYPYTQNQIMSKLLTARFRINKPPFSHVGSNLFGSFSQSQTLKRYECLFTCTTRAIQLEVVFDISISSLINYLLRFPSSRKVLNIFTPTMLPIFTPTMLPNYVLVFESTKHCVAF